MQPFTNDSIQQVADCSHVVGELATKLKEAKKAAKRIPDLEARLQKAQADLSAALAMARVQSPNDTINT